MISPYFLAVTIILDLVPGESGLGGAAIAGITCGIILSALAITAEVVFFKFFSAVRYLG